MITHSTVLAWMIPMAREAWLTAVHGIARVREDRATAQRRCLTTEISL